MRKTLLLLLSGLLATSMHAQSQGITLLDSWTDPTLPSNFYGGKFNEVWGFVQAGQEYAVIGSTNGTHIFAVTANNTLQAVDFVPGKAAGSVIIHRDYHDYAGYLYAVADEGNSSLQIMDLQYLPDSVHVVYDSDVHILRAHNIFIDSATAKLYALSCTRPQMVSFVPVSVLDISNPANPTHLTDWGNMGEVGHVHDAYLTNDTAFFNCGNDGLWMVNFAGTVPQVMATVLSYPYKGYNHSGWLSQDRNYYVMADENWGHKMKLLNVSDFSNISVVDTFLSGPTNAIPHNQMIKGNKIYTAHYHEGLRIYDMSNPGPGGVVEVASYDTYVPAVTVGSYQGAWGIYSFLPSGRLLVSDMSNGLFLLQEDALGTDEPQSNPAWFVGPNPNSGILNIHTAEPDQLHLYNLNGQLIQSWTVERGEQALHLEQVPAGMYLLHATNQLGCVKLLLN